MLYTVGRMHPNLALKPYTHKWEEACFNFKRDHQVRAYLWLDHHPLFQTKCPTLMFIPSTPKMIACLVGRD